MRRIALLVLALLVVLTVAPSTAATPRKRYVPFLDRQVRVSQLNQKVRIHDASFRDYGAAGRSGARQTFGLTGAGSSVCIVDTGVDASHEQLDNGTVAGWVDLVNGRPTPYDDNGHGTHVASIVAGNGGPSPDGHRYVGVAPDASIYAAKVLDNLGRGTFEDVVSGIGWCVDQGVDIISLSLGAPDRAGEDIAEEAVNLAVERGVTVVVSAGNSGPALGTVATPGAAAGAITVGASSEWSGGQREERSFGPYVAWFSSRGAGFSDPAQKPDIVAPGVTVKAALTGTTDEYVALSGTSMSAPYVAGTLALMEEADPDLTPTEAKEILRGTAFDAGPDGWDPDWGAGLVNSFSAVARIAGGEERNIFPPHYFLIRNKGFGAGADTAACDRGIFEACIITIGTGSGTFGPPDPPTKRFRPMAFTVHTYTEGVELDALLIDVTNPGPGSELITSVLTASVLPLGADLTRGIYRSEAFGVMPPRVGPDQGGYFLFVGPSMLFGENATRYSLGVDIFYE